MGRSRQKPMIVASNPSFSLMMFLSFDVGIIKAVNVLDLHQFELPILR